MTQKEFGEICGISQVQIARYESGNTKPSKKILARIAQGLAVPMDKLQDKENHNDPDLETLNHQYNELVEVLKDKEYIMALSKIFRSFYITCHAKVELENDI
ncbi:helix-turn-helix transcriptional regulator [Maribacter polysiphoniae]|uniref:Helix-turn-helix transcriptional regulator n=1 Tax=Maribacter polysiphoniae TaxID=429344 RepID=A0ABR7W0F4_9FLAO|nr:helix-turn-helix transcriptional regulator [Maribacter polysiphoniae]